MATYKLNEKVRLTGAFWQPGKRSKRVCGEVFTIKGKHYLQEAAKYRPERESDFRAYFAKLNSRSTSTIETLLGLSDTGKCTLLNLQESGSRGATNSRDHYVIAGHDWRVSTIVMGMHIRSWDEQDLDGCAFYLSDLDGWLQTPWTRGLQDSAMSYEFPTMLNDVLKFSSLPLRAEVTLQTVMGRKETRSQFTFKPVIRIRLIRHEKCSLAWIMEQLPKVQSFFTLLVGTSVLVKKLQIFRGENDAYVIRKRPVRKEAINIERWVRCSSEQLTFALARWLAISDHDRPVEKIVLGMLRTSRLYTETEFLSLAQSLEAFGRLRFKQKRISDSQFKQGMRALSAHGQEFWGSTDFAKRCREALSAVNEPTFAERIDKTLDLISEDFIQRLVGDRASFSQKIRQTRNYFTHLGIKRGTLVVEGGKDLFLLNVRLHALLRAVMLIDLQVPELAMRDAVLYEANRWF